MAEEKFFKKAVTQYLGAHIGKQQATVVEWVSLRPIMEVNNKETGYEGRGKAPGAVVAANSGQEAAGCYVKRYFCGGKGEALEIW